MTPTVSVIVTTYNHEKYIAQCINSILTQSFSDFELIIVDDGSSDNTRAIIQNFDDPRIIYHYQENMGPSDATNTGIALSNTEYIAFMCGDDVAHKERLHYQYHYFLEHPETTIIFGRCDIIDEDGNIQDTHPLKTLFDDVTYTNRYQFFNRLFFFENCLNAVTCMLRRSFFDKTPGYQLASLQLQDYKMWLDWLKHSEITLLDEKFIYYRVRNNNQNLSSTKNSNRVFFEYGAILENILDDLDKDFFKATFAKEIKKLDFSTPAELELEKAFLYLKHSDSNVQRIGLKKLFLLLQNDTIRKTYLDEYGMSFKEYFFLTETTLVHDRNLEKKYHHLETQYNALHYEVARFLPLINKYHKAKQWLKTKLGF